MPAMMADGRFLSNNVPTPAIDEILKSQSGIPDNFQYRQYLQNNGSNIIYNNLTNAWNNSSNLMNNW